MIGLNKIGLNQVQLNLVQLNQLYLNTLCAGQKRSGGDGFPRLPGDVTRWSFKGLTNEMMAKNPRLEDADHKGRFLTFKNFAWAYKSGCGGFFFSSLQSQIEKSVEYNLVGNKITLHKVLKDTKVVYTFTQAVSVGEEISYTIKISGLTDLNKSNPGFTFRNLQSRGLALNVTSDGIYTVRGVIDESSYSFISCTLYNSNGIPAGLDLNVTIEEFPNYPGFIIGDGVDDYAVTEKDLDFEDTYTVYTAFIPFQGDPARNMVLFGKNYLRDIDFRFTSYVTFYSANSYAVRPLSNGFNLFACKRTIDKLFLKNMITGVSIEVDANALINNPGLYYLWRSATASYAKAAIAGQVICNGHFTTDEEDTKVLNWYKKEYPWLFFDQAWTVVGKSNEDTNRNTIANITGNGNNLVLSNFGFAGNSGYGEYAYNWNEWGIDNGAATNVSKQYNKFVAVMPVNQSISTCSLYSSEVSIGTKFQFKLKITGLTTNWIVRVMEGYTGDSNIIYEFDKDGTYQIDHTMTGSGNQLRLYIRMYCAVPNTEGTTVTVEQIPDNQGYLVTDGVDDIIKSSLFTIGKHFTVVGDWKLLNNEIVNAGIIKSGSLFIYNTIPGLRVFINRAGNSYNVNTKTLRAIVSDGRMYDDNWKEYLDTNKQLLDKSGGAIFIGSSEAGSLFTRLIFKNLAIYPRFISKEDCIKAYIYLQTLKAK